MVAIYDVADAAPVVAWLRRFTSNPPNDLILMTGEGVGRLVGFARRAGCLVPLEIASWRKFCARAIGWDT
jgi:hypothetical protein